MPQPDTQTRILDAAELLVQTRGFNAFSYADIAQALGLTKAALHHHFPTKALLGERLITRYRERFLARLAEIDASGAPPAARLALYAAIFIEVLATGRMCLCGMMAADHATLPEPMRAALSAFFVANEAWLAATLAAGRAAGTLAFAGPCEEAARLLVAALEGAMLLARAHRDPSRLTAAAARLLSEVTGPKAPPGPLIPAY